MPACKSCHKKKYNAEYWREYNTKHKEQRSLISKRWNRKLREEVIQHYGGKCACCYERTFEFLAIDHIEGGGRQHRKKIRQMIHYWLWKNNFPPGFRILCHNCNMAYGRYGYCPHRDPVI